MRFLLLSFLCLAGAAQAAEPWTFGEAITVAGDRGVPHYHHLDGAGRQHVATSETEVAVVWEDDHSGAPQVYIAIKPRLADEFSRRYQLSDGQEAYEPAVAVLDHGRWLAAWEQDGAVMARVIDDRGLGPVQALASVGSRQVSLASEGTAQIAAVWAREHNQGQLIEAAFLRVDSRRVIPVAAAVAVAAIAGHPFQGYPAIAWGPEGRLLVAWEDRRAGHTRLFHTWKDQGLDFVPERQLNEHNAPTENGREIGLGSGVMRVMLAADAAGAVRAVWLDKRDGASGYAVWGAASQDGGRTFGANRIVQDELGAAVAQWHAALAGGRGGFVAAWDDAREGWGDSTETGDVILSWSSDDSWSQDLVVPNASGGGYQGSPAIAIDPHGDLHLIWIERDDLSSPTRLRYLHGILNRPE